MAAAQMPTNTPHFLSLPLTHLLKNPKCRGFWEVAAESGGWTDEMAPW